MSQNPKKFLIVYNKSSSTFSGNNALFFGILGTTSLKPLVRLGFLCPLFLNFLGQNGVVFGTKPIFSSNSNNSLFFTTQKIIAFWCLSPFFRTFLGHFFLFGTNFFDNLGSILVSHTHIHPDTRGLFRLYKPDNRTFLSSKITLFHPNMVKNCTVHDMILLHNHRHLTHVKQTFHTLYEHTIDGLTNYLR